MACIATLGYLFINQAPDNANTSVASTSSEANIAPKLPKTTSVVELVPETMALADIEKQPASKAGTAGSSTKKLISLQCKDGKIFFSGSEDLKFVGNQPSLEVTEDNGVSFSHLVFDGTDQSAELPHIPKQQGSLVIVAKMPSRVTSIFFDSKNQHLTLRKNSRGLRWRVQASQESARIRDVKAKVDFNQWHHIAISWKSGKDAILYVDGQEADRSSYRHELLQSPEYTDVVLGRTRGIGGGFYKCRIHEFTVYNQPLPDKEIADLNQSVRQAYPFIFR